MQIPLRPYSVSYQGQLLSRHVGLIKWHGRFLQARWQDSELSQSGCFAWLRDWSYAPTHTIAGVMELYEQLPPTKVYTVNKTDASQGDVTCRLCEKSPETLAHVLAGCSALAQSKYLERHNAALKVLFFEMTRDLRLIDSVPPWYSCAVPRPVYESSVALAFWMSQFMWNTPSSRLTEWTLDLWTTRIRRCGLWRCPVRGWNIGKRSPRRRRWSTGHCDSSWRSSSLAMRLNNVTSSLICWRDGQGM